MIDLRYVKKLVELLDGSTVDSIEISTDKGMKIRISKSSLQRGAMQVATTVPVPALAPIPVTRNTPTEGFPVIADAGGTGGSAPAGTAPGDVAKSKLLEVKSPMVGTFYASPEPGSQPYVSEGTRVTKGQIVCIIEAMKIMNEIESEFSGVIREILVQDAHPVEYGQVLFRIEPNG
jgi:acetyl-CoA carboxylase biotin carboxyl carrier protein